MKEVTDFKYLGSWVESTERDIKARRAAAWRALHKMRSIWKSNLDRATKIPFFLATVESVLLYGSECWTLTKALEKSLDGCYTRMLKEVLNIKGNVHLPNTELYKGLPRISNKIANRRMRLAGHCHRHPELPANQVILWEPKHGHRRRGRPPANFIDTLKRDAGIDETRELAALMENRDLWTARCSFRLRTS